MVDIGNQNVTQAELSFKDMNNNAAIGISAYASVH
jgi:hypothetical protein